LAGEEEILRITVRGRSRAEILRAMAAYDADTGCTPARPGADGQFEIEAFVSRDTANLLASRADRSATQGFQVRIHEDVRSTFARKQQLVRKAGARAVGDARVRGLGIKE
jgi:hypothetical protein